MKFAVSIINPPNYHHARSVWEVAETVHYGLLQLGHDSVLTFETNISDRQHITLLPNLLTSYTGTLAPNTILYNLDQIYPGSPWLQPVVLDHFLQYPVWDYSQANIDQFRQLGISSVQHVPIGYVPELTRIPAAEEEDIDILFYGSVNERRHQILESLQAHGVKVEAIFGVYGEDRDAYIARSKIVLNMHFYPAKVFEIVRVSYLLANRRFVISERGCDPTEESAFAEGVVFSDYENLVESCLHFLEHSTDRNQIAEAGFELIRQRSELNYLRTALESIQPNRRADERFFQKDLYRKNRAANCLEMGDLEQAIALYEESLATDPTCTLSYWNLGLALLLSGDAMAAQFCWASGLSQGDAENPEALSAELLQVLQQAAKKFESHNPEPVERIKQQIAELDPTTVVELEDGS